MKIRDKYIVKKCEWLDKEAGIYNEEYTSNSVLFGFIKWSYFFKGTHDMNKVSNGTNAVTITGFDNKNKPIK